MAQKVSADWVPIPIDQAALADNFADAIYYGETFCVNAHFVAKYLLSRAVRNDGFKVVLTGEGSDEMLGGYAHFREDMLRYDNDGQDPGEVQRLMAQLDEQNKVSQGILLSTERSAGSAMMQRVLGFTPSLYHPFLARYKRLQPLFDAEYFAPFASPDRASLLLSFAFMHERLIQPSAGSSSRSLGGTASSAMPAGIA